MLLLRVVADRQLRAVRRNTVVVVASRRESCGQDLRNPARNRNLLDPPVSVEEQVFAIGHPVGRLEPLRCNVNRAPVRGGHVDDFERAVQRGRSGGHRLCRLQLDVREHRFFHHVLIVAANADAHVKRLFQCDSRGPARQTEFALFIREPHRKVRAAFFNPQTLGCGKIGLDFARGGSFLFAVLQ